MSLASSEDGDATFSVGPNNLQIRRGECIFITGGNGSGKTSFIQVAIRTQVFLGHLLAINGDPAIPAGIRVSSRFFLPVECTNYFRSCGYEPE